jgi:hypothetical protein
MRNSLLKVGDLRQWIVMVIVPLALGCGESKLEAANREALIPILHRNRALSDEYARFVVNNEINSTVTYEQIFEQYKKFQVAKESLQAELRKIVPTPRYDCLLSLASRSMEADVAQIRARESYFQHQLKFKTANKLASSYVEQYKTTEYGGTTYLRLAKEQLDEMTNEMKEENSFKLASNIDSRTAAQIGDSLVASTLAFKLLPSMARPRYPIVTDSGKDSLTGASNQTVLPTCASR